MVQGSGGGAQGCASSGDVINQENAFSGDVFARPGGEGIFDIAQTCRGRTQRGLRVGVTCPTERVHNAVLGKLGKFVGQQCRLVKTSPPVAPPVQRDRDDDIGFGQKLAGIRLAVSQTGERGGQRPAAGEFEAMHKVPGNALVQCEAEGAADQPAGAVEALRTRFAGVVQRIAADVAPGF